MKKYKVLITIFPVIMLSTSVQARMDMGPQFPPSVYPEYYKNQSVGEQHNPDASQDNQLSSARLGDADSQITVALEYLTGHNRPQSYEQAFKWLKLAEQNGSEEAPVYLASMYYFGEGVQQNYHEAFQRFSKAANAGNSLAQFNLHIMYDVGYGVLVDKKEALYWLRKSAEAGFAKAQTKLGMLYKSGGLLQRNLKKSIEWLHRAANAGDAEAQIQLAKNYAMGIGARQNYLVSYIWFNIAGEHCEPGIERQQCIDYTHSIASILSPTEMEKAKRLVTLKKQDLAEKSNSLTVEKVIIQ